MPGKLLVRFYYPASVETVKSYPWFPRTEYIAGTGTFLGRSPWLFTRLWKALIGSVEVSVSDGAALASTATPLPLIVFSHGLGSFRGSYAAVCGDLASHGFLVASVEHRDASACWTYDLDESGAEVPTSFRVLLLQDFEARNGQIRRRISEAVETLELCKELNLRGSKAFDGLRLGLGGQFDWDSFIGRVDTSNVAVVGHSFGGGTALGALAACKEFKTGVLLDAWLYPLDRRLFSDKESVSQPLFFLNASQFKWPDNLTAMRRFWQDSSGSERLMWTIENSQHALMSDYSFLLGPGLGKKFGTRTEVDPWKQMELNNRLTRAWLAKHMGLEGEKLDDVVSAEKEMLIPDTPHIPIAPVDPDFDKLVDEMTWTERPKSDK